MRENEPSRADAPPDQNRPSSTCDTTRVIYIGRYFPVKERANYTSMSEKPLPPNGDYETSLQPRSHNEYQLQNSPKTNSPYNFSNGPASFPPLATMVKIGRAHV